jgi:hypothetical protein
MIDIKEETKRQGKTKRRETKGKRQRVMRETVKEGETDRLGETERDDRQKGMLDREGLLVLACGEV